MLRRIGASAGIAVTGTGTGRKNGYHMHKTEGIEQPWHWSYFENGREIARSSENYKARIDCHRGITIMKATAKATIYGEDGKPETDGVPLRRP